MPPPSQPAQPAQSAPPALRIADDVRDAVASGHPVLALESTILTHGLPAPQNLGLALEAEQIVRGSGCVPATIGVVGGIVTVGCSDAELERLCTSDDVMKASLRDLAVAVTTGGDAGTTVAATAWLAHRAGIRVMSTGGLGGVHRGAAETFDESADLGTLATTPITLVCSGVKSILDVGATIERLETLNVTVAAYRTDRFPGFTIADSGFPAPSRIEGTADAAALARARDALGVSSAVLIANPVAAADQLDPDLHDRVLAEALAAASAAGIAGHDATPFLLDFMQRATGGASLRANLALYRANVALGAEIARELAG